MSCVPPAVTSGAVGLTVEDMEKVAQSHDPCGPTSYPWGVVSCAQHIGRRRRQEDRFTICPDLGVGERSAFVGVWDGTVGDFASHNVQGLVLPHTVASPAWQELAAGGSAPRPLLERAVREGYVAADAQLVALCAEANNDYASTTSVTAVIANDVLTVAHLGDSRAVLVDVDESTGSVSGAQLTADHKPDLPEERARIEASGGSVEFLTDSHFKPFIRGGDFLARKAQGGKPMQLQYSRAFGGKDLKPYGLSCVPDVVQVDLASTPRARYLILASDGLWDVCTAADAAHIAHLVVSKRAEAEAVAAPAVGGGDAGTAGAGRGATPASLDPSVALVNFALEQQQLRGDKADNVTVLTVELPPAGRATAPSAT